MKRVYIKAKYVNEEVDVVLKEYTAGAKTLAILLLDPETGEEIAMPTAHVEGIPEGCVAVKNYSENEGMLQALQQAGVISAPVGQIPSGFVVLYICKLLVEEENDEQEGEEGSNGEEEAGDQASAAPARAGQAK